VHRLTAETGALESLGVDLAGFDASVHADPVGCLSLEPLQQFRAEGGALNPGQLLNVYPPYCTDVGEVERSLRAIPAADRIGFLASFAAQIRGLPDGTAIRLEVE